MIPFAVEHVATDFPVRGLIARGEARQALHAKIAARADQYGQLAIALGADWTALLATSDADADLPWTPEPLTYLYALNASCFCEINHRPNVPPHLQTQMIVTLRAQCDLPSAFALTHGPKVFDLSEAQFVQDITPGTLV